MSTYRRHYLPGGTYFFTVVLQDRTSDLLLRHIDLFKTAWHTERAQTPFQTLACVVLPDHIHAIWRLPDGDTDFSGRWQRIKGRFSSALPKLGRPSYSQIKHRERGIWQRRFWEHTIRDDTDLRIHIEYVHLNPVKHGYVTHAIEWPHSTLHRSTQKWPCPQNRRNAQ